MWFVLLIEASFLSLPKFRVNFHVFLQPSSTTEFLADKVFLEVIVELLGQQNTLNTWQNINFSVTNMTFVWLCTIIMSNIGFPNLKMYIIVKCRHPLFPILKSSCPEWSMIMSNVMDLIGLLKPESLNMRCDMSVSPHQKMI